MIRNEYLEFTNKDMSNLVKDTIVSYLKALTDYSNCVRSGKSETEKVYDTSHERKLLSEMSEYLRILTKHLTAAKIYCLRSVGMELEGLLYNTFKNDIPYSEKLRLLPELKDFIYTIRQIDTSPTRKDVYHSVLRKRRSPEEKRLRHEAGIIIRNFRECSPTEYLPNRVIGNLAYLILKVIPHWSVRKQKLFIHWLNRELKRHKFLLPSEETYIFIAVFMKLDMAVHVSTGPLYEESKIAPEKLPGFKKYLEDLYENLEKDISPDKARSLMAKAQLFVFPYIHPQSLPYFRGELIKRFGLEHCGCFSSVEVMGDRNVMNPDYLIQEEDLKSVLNDKVVRTLSVNGVLSALKGECPSLKNVVRKEDINELKKKADIVHTERLYLPEKYL